MNGLSVVIPALNEEDGIESIMTRVLSIRSNLNAVGIQDLELIVVDDGSTDRTPEIVKATQGTRLIRHATNGGYGAALKTGFAAADGPVGGLPGCRWHLPAGVFSSALRGCAGPGRRHRHRLAHGRRR